MLILTGPAIYTENSVLKDTALVIQDKKICALATKKNYSSVNLLEFPTTYHIVPGFIDIHIHGANNFDVMDANFSALAGMSAALVREGTTSYLATTMTAPIIQLEAALKNVGHFMQAKPINGARLLGVHLEGPFLSAKKTGAQNADNLLLPEKKYISSWQKISANAIKLVTLAPELPHSSEFIEFLRSQNIIAAIGHTDATYAETLLAIEAGCTHVTHLFNAMRGIHQREPGIAAAALLTEKLSVEIIVDGIHLHPAMVQLVMQNKTLEKIILVTDAMRAKCLSDGEYDLGGQTVKVQNKVASLADGTLAGSTLTMHSALQNMLQFTGCDLMTAIKFAAENPAKLLNLFHRKGSIALQKDADLVVLDEKLNVVMTIVEGEICYRRE